MADLMYIGSILLFFALTFGFIQKQLKLPTLRMSRTFYARLLSMNWG